MTKKQSFINWIEQNVDTTIMPEDVKSYWDCFITVKEKEKPNFTENGKMILKYMQDAAGTHFTSKEIAEALTVSSRTVSGAMRKLVSDNYVEKISADPVVYEITDKGRAVEWEN